MNDSKSVTSICILVTDFDSPSGGVQKNSRVLLRELEKRAVRAFVLARNYYGLERTARQGSTTVIRLPVYGNSRTVNGIIYFVTGFFWLLRNRSKYELVHCQQMFGPTMVALVAGLFTGKCVVTRVTTVGPLGEVKAVREMPLSFVRRRLLKRVSRWIALTAEMRREIETLGVEPDRIDVICNSTELPLLPAADRGQKSALREQFGIPSDCKIAIFVGRLSTEKGVDILLRAWQVVASRCSKVRLLILGSGGAYRNVEDELKGLARSLNIGDTTAFLGHVDNAKEYLLAADLFVLPSSTEGMSNSLVEAFACGLPIIASDIASNRELCCDRQNALLVPFGDVLKWANALTLLIEDGALADNLASESRATALKKLSNNVMVDNYLHAYEAALRGR